MSKTAFVFAGQGAQAVGMGKDLAEAYPACAELFKRADAALGYSLSQICFAGPAEALTKTQYCQPAIFVVSVAALAALRAEGVAIEPAAVAGLSLGEWTALHVAGVLGFEDTLRVLDARGRFMQEACEERPGGMVSLMGAGEDKARELAAATGVEVANINAADQIVLSGDKARIAEVEKQAAAFGAKRAVVLNVAGAYHSSLMASAARKLEAFLAGVTFSTPRLTVLSNVAGAPHGDVAALRQAMVAQVTGSVRWAADVAWLQGQGVTRYLEFGPGKVLSGLIKRIDSAAVAINISDAPTAKKAAEQLKA